MSPYDQAFLPGNRVLLYLEGPSALPRELTGTVLGMNPVGLVVYADPGSLDEGTLRLSHVHDDGKLPPLFLSWNCIRGAFLLGAPKERPPVEIPVPKCMQDLEAPKLRPAPQPRAQVISSLRHPPEWGTPESIGPQANADWVPGDEPVPRVPVVKPPIATPEVTLSDTGFSNDFHAALVAELNALRKAGKLYG